MCTASSGMRVAAVQMVSSEDLAANLESAARLVRFAAEQGARLVLLPEYFPVLGMDETCKLRLAEPEGRGPVQDFLSALAREESVWLVAGTLPLSCQDPGRVRNACLVSPVSL